jgi:hypothetical protein
MKPRTITLPKFDEEDEPLVLFAIITPATPPHIAWLLNKTLHTQFEDKGEIKHSTGNAVVEFPVFVSPSEFEDGCYTLFTNNVAGTKLISRYPHIDYFLQYSEPLNPEEQKALSAQIRRLPSVTLCYPLPCTAKEARHLAVMTDFALS